MNQMELDMTALDIKNLIINTLNDYLNNLSQHELELKIALATRISPPSLQESLKKSLHDLERKQRAHEIRHQFALQKEMKASIIGELSDEEVRDLKTKLLEKRESLNSQIKQCDIDGKNALKNFIRPTAKHFLGSRYADFIAIDSTANQYREIEETINTFKEKEQDDLFKLLDSYYLVMGKVVVQKVLSEEFDVAIKPLLIKMHWAKEVALQADLKLVYQQEKNALDQRIFDLDRCLSLQVSATSVNEMKQQLGDEFLIAFNKRANEIKVEFNSDAFMKDNERTLFTCLTQSLHNLNPLSPDLSSALASFDRSDARMTTLQKLKDELLNIVDAHAQRLTSTDKQARLSGLTKLIHGIEVNEQTSIKEFDDLLGHWKDTVINKKSNETVFQSNRLGRFFCSLPNTSLLVIQCHNAIERKSLDGAVCATPKEEALAQILMVG